MRTIFISVMVLLTGPMGTSWAGPIQIHRSEPPEAVYYANAYADHYGLPRSLVHAVIEQESGWDPHAVSPKGALGIMQLMPDTARQYGVQHPFSKVENIGAGTRYLADLVRAFHGDLRLAVAAYYCGNHPIQRWGLRYSNADVFQYVSSVRALYVRDLARHEASTVNPDNRKTVQP
ncbi:MAG: lytic transglycosylase domain-containing protein [Acidobacteriaceae bacterium]